MQLYGPIRKLREENTSPQFRRLLESILHRSAPLAFNQITDPLARVPDLPLRLNIAEQTDTQPLPRPLPLPSVLLPPLCVRCHISGAEVSSMIGGCSRAPHRCTKQHFHDKLAPQQICSAAAAAAAAATAVQLIHTQHLHTDGNDLCGHGDCHADARNASSSFCCCSGTSCNAQS